MGMLEDAFNGAMRGAERVARDVGREIDRAGKELGENFEKDGARIGNATTKGGLLGGFVEAADVFSPGHQSVNLLDAFNVIPEDPALHEGLSAGINFATGLALAAATGGTAAGPLALGGTLLAAKDLADLCAVPAQHAPMAGPHCTQSPREAYGQATCGGRGKNPRMDDLRAHKAAAKDAARAHAIDLAKAASADARQAAGDAIAAKNGAVRDAYRDGYAAGVAAGAGIDIHIDVGGCNRLIGVNDDVFGEDKTSQVEDEIDRLLSDPSLCFEDMIFQLMRAIMKDSQGMAKEMATELRGQRAEERTARGDWDQKISDKQKEISGEKDPARKNDLQNELQSLREQRAGDLGDKADSRNQIAEDLKNLMQKLSEMQQAMSNVLNAQHESAMSAIKNIR